MMRTTVVIFSIVCVATVLSEILGGAFLWYRGQLTADSIADIRLALSGEDQDAFGIDVEDKPDQLSSDDFIRQRTMRILELNVRQDELDLLKKMVTDNRKKLIADQETFKEKKNQFQTQLGDLLATSTANATEQTRGILRALAPADAMDNLMTLPVTDNVVLLQGMPEKSIAKILKEFQNGDEAQRLRGQEIFKAVSQGEPSKGLIDETLSKLSGAAPATN
jgi:hypothetical protein